MDHIEAQGRAPSTLTRDRSAISANIKPHLGNLPLAKVGPAELDGLYSRLAKTGLSPLSIRKSHAILSAAFNQAVRWGWVDVNPVLRASPPSSRGREIRPPTQPELRRLLGECAEDHEDLGTLIFVAATMTIARSISDAGTQGEVKGTKTHQARRIALDQATTSLLRTHRGRVEERAAAAGTALRSDAYVWSQDLDAATPYRPDRVTGEFRTLRDRLDLPHVTFHSLRHFTATTLAAGGVGIRTIAGRLRHANPGITLRTYAHFLDAADREAADALGLALADLQPSSMSRSKASSNARRGTTIRRPSLTDGSSRRATKS